MISRQDKVVKVNRPNNGGSVCDHVDGTRITKYCRTAEKGIGEEEEEQPGAIISRYRQARIRIIVIIQSKLIL